MAVALITLAAGAAAATGCGGGSSDPSSEATVATVAQTDTTMKETAPATTEVVQLDAEDDGALTPAEIYARVAPSVVFIETPDGTGSGIVMPGGYVLTNAHVTSLHPTVLVHGVNGPHPDVPVHARDWLRDLALVGPFDHELPALGFAPERPLLPGEPVYLVGFPGEAEAAPEATITAGLVSRLRQQTCVDLEYIQTDALIAGGQSGGALVDAAGTLVGISGLGAFTEANFGLVLSGARLGAALSTLEAGARPLVDGEDPATVHRPWLDIGLDAAYRLVVDEPRITFTVSIDPPGGEDVYVEVMDMMGNSPWLVPDPTAIDHVYPPLNDGLDGDATADTGYYADDYIDGEEQLTVELDRGTYVVRVGSFEWAGHEATLNVSKPVQRIADPEEFGPILEFGGHVDGIIGHPWDVDRFAIHLMAGTEVRIRADSIGDPMLSVYDGDTLVASNDDSGSGLYGSLHEVHVAYYEGAIDGYRLSAGAADDPGFCGTTWWPRPG